MNPLSKYSPQLLKHHVFEVGARNRNGPGYPVYSVTNYNGFVPSEEYFKKQVFSKDTANYKIVPRGAFAYNPSRINVGSIDYLRHETPVLVSPLYIVFNTSDELHPAYLKRFLLSEAGMSQIDHYTQGAVRDSLKFSGLQKIEIPLPPLEEQKRIAAVLDKADALRRQRQESLELTEKLLQSVFIEMFGDPAGQPQKRLIDLLKKPLRNGLSPASGGTHKGTVFTLSAITRGIFDSSARKEAVFASPPKAAAQVDKADFLICRGNGNIKLCGQGQFPTDDAIGIIFPDTMIAASIDLAQVAKAYFATLWNQPFVRRQIEEGARTAAGIFKVNQTTLENIKVPVPDIARQIEFGQIAVKILEGSKNLQLSAQHAGNLFASLQQRAFRGELDLSRVVLDAEAPEQEPKPDEILVPEEPPKSLGIATGFASFRVRYRRFVPDKSEEAKLKILDAQLERGDQIEWSPDYFRFRLLGQQAESFRAGDILQKAATLFTEESLPDRDNLVSQMLDMLEAVGELKVPAPLLKQRFDEKRQEIRLELVP